MESSQSQKPCQNLEELDKKICQYLNLFHIETRNLDVYIEKNLSSARKICKNIGKEENNNTICDRHLNCEDDSNGSDTSLLQKTLNINKQKKRCNKVSTSACQSGKTINSKFDRSKEESNETKNERCMKIANFAQKLKLR